MRLTRRLLWQLYPAFLLIMLVGLGGVAWLNVSAQRAFIMQETRARLESNARATGLLFAGVVRKPPGQLEALCIELGRQMAERLTIVQTDGVVLCDSDKDPAYMDNHLDRPEVQQALAGRVGTSLRYSQSVRRQMMYVAAPIRDGDRIAAIVRVSMPIQALEDLIASRSEQILLAVGLIAVLSAVLTYFVARRISRPLMVLEQGAGRFAAGDLTYRLPTATAGDVASLAETFNQMAATLNERIATITQQRNELEAVLANMDEAVLVVDVQKRLLRCNALAARLYAFDRRSAIDRPIAELVHHAEALDFVDRVLASAKPLEKIFVSPDGRRFWQVRGTLLRSAADDTLGALVVLRDVTADYRLEQVRRDFVANVSHELKTPITSIKGFVETLRDGAIHETTNAEKFLEIIGRHVERVEAIIEDLLALSRIEQEEDKAYLYLAPTAIHEVLESAMLVCGGKARDKNITILTDCLTDLRAKVNPALLEQAIVNLLDNAIKYSPPDSRIELRAAGADGNLQVSVTDQGSGISAEHLPRIFERFYRVDKARSRKLGGTGLGLAIVKHIVQAHGGHVDVTSEVGKGSVFTLTVPLRS